MSISVSSLRSRPSLALSFAPARPGLVARGLTSRAATAALLVLAVPFVVLANRPLGGDVWWALAYARLLVANGHLPTADPFTFSPHSTGFVDAQWLSQLLYFVPYRIAGLEAVMAFNAAVCTASAAIVLHAGWRRSGSLGAAATSVLLFTLPAFWLLFARAQTLALLPFAATYWLLLCAATRPRTLVALGAVEVAWANMHGSFFLAPMLSALFLAARALEVYRAHGVRGVVRDRRSHFLVGAGIVQASASLATPHGFDLYRYALSLSAHPVVRQAIDEWLPTSLAKPDGWQFFAALGITLLFVACSRRKMRPLEAVLLAVFVVMGLQAIRNVVWFALICPPLIAPFLADLRAPRPIEAFAAWLRQPDRSRTSELRLVVLALAVVMAVPAGRGLNPLVEPQPTQVVDDIYPQAAASFLMAHEYGPNVMSDHYWGAYLDWHFEGRYKAMVDAAIEAHPLRVWQDFASMQMGVANWQDLADQYGVDVLMLSHANQFRLIDVAWASPRWRLVYSDTQAAIFVRSQEVLA